MPQADPATVVEAARRLLVRPDLADALVRRSGVVAPPVPVLQPDTLVQVAWFVPVTVEAVLAGFFVLGTDLSLRRWSTFQRHRDSLEGCPSADDWLSPERIVARALQTSGGGTAGTPYLSFDTVPDRIAWIVPVDGSDVFVAGTTSWSARS
jgi:hypothetical protein